MVALAGIDIACLPQAKDFYWVVTDPIGKPIAMTSTPLSGSAQVVWKASYSPFGRAIESMDPDGDGTSIATPVRFPGQWSDFATGLHYNFFRDYDPQTGRYLEPDPSGQLGLLASVAQPALEPGRSTLSRGALDGWPSKGLFAYSFSNPINFFDPNGLDVFNNSFLPIFVLPEEGKGLSDLVCIRPGGEFLGRQDAFAVPGTNAVFKTTDFVDATVGPQAEVSRLTTRASGSGNVGAGLVDAVLLLGQLVRGGPLTPKEVAEAGTAFESLFQAANQGICECPRP
jgi:RHS repeat-associated protein